MFEPFIQIHKNIKTWWQYEASRFTKTMLTFLFLLLILWPIYSVLIVGTVWALMWLVGHFPFQVLGTMVGIIAIMASWWKANKMMDED